jgi:hypothetical protein
LSTVTTDKERLSAQVKSLSRENAEIKRREETLQQQHEVKIRAMSKALREHMLAVQGQCELRIERLKEIHRREIEAPKLSSMDSE